MDEFPQLFKRKEWQALKDKAHKLKGGASYCGALRLDRACQKLISCLQTDTIENAKVFYDEMIQEMIAVKAEANAYISSLE